ncbi:hypothetical protein ACCW94_21945 [Enterobacter soli]|uniref:hypothetical protein n=1 Tax=Enterobacter soli TaxID=885040 RepID=UPI003ED91BD1
MTNLPSTQVYTLSDLNINLNNTTINLSKFIIEKLYSKTLNGIISAFHNSIILNTNGAVYLNVAYLHTLLRTNPGAASTIWQDGISGYVSGVDGKEIFGNLYISGPDFIGLVDARIQTAIGISKLYLQYIQAAYYTISSHQHIADVRTAFIDTIGKMRSELKRLRILEKNISKCEFSDIAFNNNSQVDFAHINSVVTDPENALNVNNGVIILKKYHSELTKKHIQDFSGMYQYCLSNKLSIVWAEEFDQE